MELSRFISRVQKVLTEPRREFIRIKQENLISKVLLGNYILPLVIIDAIATFIGKIVFGPATLTNGSGIIIVNILMIASVQLIAIYLSTYLVNELLQLFQTKKDFNSVFNLIAFSFTPIFIATIGAGLLPKFAKFINFFGFYSLIVFWIGSDIIVDITKDRKQVFVPVAVIVIGLIYMATWGIIGVLFSF